MKTIGAFDMWAAQARALMRMMKALVSGVGRIVSAFFKLGVTLLDIGFLLLGLGNEWEAFKTTVVDVVDTIGDKFNWLKDKIQNWGDAVQENIDQVNREADMFIEWVDNIANAVEQLDGFIDKLEELRDFLKGGGLRELGEDFLSIGGDEGISAPGGPLGGLTGSGLGQLTGSSTGTGGVVQNITNNISGAVGGQPIERAAILDDLRDMLRTEGNRFGIPRKFGT